MKNQYFGDVNDYRKYGLLRMLSGGDQFKIGVCWMLTADDRRTDGRFTNYLSQPRRWRRYDPPLFDQLQQWVTGDNLRNVRLMQSGRLLPGAEFYDELMTDQPDYRRAYFERMRRRLAGTDLIFFDPDNGVETKSTPIGRKDSSKYIYWDELHEAFGAGQSILMYQHFRREKRVTFIQRIAAEFKSRLGATEVRWFRTPHVAFFLAVQPSHIEYIRNKVQLVADHWSVGGQILTG